MEKNEPKEPIAETSSPTPAIRLVTVEVVHRVAENASKIREATDAARFLSELIGDKDREHFVVLHLDATHRIIAAETVSIGTLTGALVHFREVFKAAILNNAQAIICGHNHPSGDMTPSSEDRQVEKRLREAGALLGIPLLDFIIVAGVKYWSIQES